MTSPTMIGAYLVLFALIGATFLLVNLLAGWLVRPKDPHEEKLEIYECGEPAIGSSFVQFDLRFYVVALIFIVFEAEVAFLFPVSTALGKAANLAAMPEAAVVATEEGVVLSATAAGLYRELGVDPAAAALPADVAAAEAAVRHGARQLAWMAFWAIQLFFFILLAGFAYEWKVGSLDWVRGKGERRELAKSPPATSTPPPKVGVPA